VPVVGCSFSLTVQFRVKVLLVYEASFLYFANSGLLP
jgi:hypothetical protein